MDLNNFLKQERSVWGQKAGINRAKWRDMNTRYFHSLAKIKSCRRKISCLKNNDNEWVMEDGVLKKMMTDYFEEMFTTSHLNHPRRVEFQSRLVISDEWKDRLSRKVDETEISAALSQMAPLKSPGGDGIQAVFFKNFWDQMGPSVIKLISNAFETNCIPSGLSDSLLALIPKIDPPVGCKDFRLIGLCNTVYKLITKVIANRIKPVLDGLIHPSQTSFVPGRNIQENVVIAKEMAFFFKKSPPTRNIMALKIDLSKAYDSLEWGFIRDTLYGFSFPNSLISLIMDCICSPAISLIWNGEVTKAFLPSRGIRQGDPLSPYIFVLCMERVSIMINEKINEGNWRPIKLSQDLGVSHIFYADDVFLFGQASCSNGKVILDVLEEFGKLSGLRVNVTKSLVIFPPKMNHQKRRILAEFLSIKEATSFGKYLGCNILPNKLRRGDYDGLLEKVKNSIRGWQAKFLNMAGRCTLIKVVVTSFPVYGMQTSILPMSVTKEIERDCRKFLWNKVDKTYYMARVSWDRVCKPWMKGGLGLRKPVDWNMAFMAKLGWKILKEESKLWVNILKVRYWAKKSFLYACAKNHHSPVWRDIFRGRGVLERGLIRRIGDGRTISLWYQWWVGNEPLVRVVTGAIPEYMSHWQVKEIILNGRWDTQKIDHLIPPDLLKQIREILLATVGAGEDDYIWKFEKNGSFSVKSAYYLASSPSIDNSGSGIWKVIWKQNIPFKYKMLLWNGYHEILPSSFFLSCRIPNFNPQCVLCDQAGESLIHLFRDCCVALMLWTEILKRHKPLNYNHNLFFSLDWVDWISFNLHQSDAWVTKFTTALSHLWCSRNKGVFEAAVTHPRFLLNRVMADFFTNLKAFRVEDSKVSGGTPVLRWKPPRSGFLKLNTDGAWKTD